MDAAIVAYGGEEKQGRVVVSAGQFSIGSTLWPGISKLTEEAGEVLQVCGKLIGTGGNPSHWDGTDLRQRLEDELGDLLAAISFVVKHCNLNRERVFGRSAEKFSKFEQWHKEQS